MAKAGKRQALFLDLHGILLHPWTDREDYIHPRFLDGGLEALSRIDPSKMDIFIATNQSDVAKGALRERDFKKFHEAVGEAFRQAAIPLKKFYSCLFHPQGKGRWRKESVFRKPNIGMFKMAEQEFDLNLKRSWLICHSTSDLLAGDRAGLGTILVETGLAGRDGEFISAPHFCERDFTAAIRRIQLYELALTR